MSLFLHASICCSQSTSNVTGPWRLRLLPVCLPSGLCQCEAARQLKKTQNVLVAWFKTAMSRRQ